MKLPKIFEAWGGMHSLHHLRVSTFAGAVIHDGTQSAKQPRCLLTKHKKHTTLSERATWRTFLDNHIGTLVSVDFFTLPTNSLG